MELKTKYQYTYLIYPFFTDKDKYKNCIGKLLKNKNCKLEVFRKNQDIGLYNYFLPKVRKYLFEMEKMSDNVIKELERLDVDTKSAILAQNSAVFFKYCLDYKLKKTEPNKIAFDISDVKIIYTRTGIGFILIKTILTNTSKFNDALNFNYKLKNFWFEDMLEDANDNVLMDTESVQACKRIRDNIISFINDQISYKKIEVKKQDVYQYSYICLDSESWNNNTDPEVIKTAFDKLSVFEKDDVSKIKKNNYDKVEKYNPSKYIKYAFNQKGTVLLTSAISIDNYTRLAYSYENEYLYSYIYNLYKKFELKRLYTNVEIQNNYKKLKNDLFEFNNEIWINEITEDEKARKIIKKWEKVLDLENLYNDIKNKYDKLTKKHQYLNNIISKAIIAIISICGIAIGSNGIITILGLRG